MKINQDLRIPVDKMPKDQRQAGSMQARFGQMVQQHDQKLHLEQLNQLLSTIGNAGSRLGKSRSFRDLAKYKTLVKKFLKEAVDYGWSSKNPIRGINLVKAGSFASSRPSTST